jgi:very-short-patch-repair endonuclease
MQLVDLRRLDNRDLDQRFHEDGAEPFFVKNLENVQGDERDHMIMCIGYGPTSSGRVFNRFGPINTEGGGRRLNVAITRARRRMSLVRSLTPSDITSEGEGPRLLRRYLEFAANPDTAIEGEVSIDAGADADSPFEEAVGRALERRGYRIARQVGVAGYRVDIAILSEDSSGIDLGIECDGTTYHSAPAARDRDWLREEVLKGLGWNIHRIWSTSWVRNPEGEIQALEQALSHARAKTSVVPAIVPPAPEADAEAEATDDTYEDAPIVSDESAEVEAKSAFQEYVSASLEGLRKGPQLQHETAGNLSRMISEIVQTEGPVHVDIVVERIRHYYGLGRVRGATREHLMSAIERAARSGLVKKQGDFIWSNYAQLAQPPRASGSGAAARSIEQIHPDELKQALLLTVASIFGGSRDDVVSQTARNLGYQRTGPSIKQVLETAIDQMLESGDLVESFGMITISG